MYLYCDFKLESILGYFAFAYFYLGLRLISSMSHLGLDETEVRHRGHPSLEVSRHFAFSSIIYFFQSLPVFLSYKFYLDNVLNPNSHPLDTFFEGVSAGLHYVTVIDTSSACTLPVPVTINAPDFPLQLILSDSMNICSGGTDGIAIGEAIGGTPGYVYSWYESGNPQSFSDNDTAFNLSAGSYYLEVTDTNGCDTIASINVLEPQVSLHGVVQVFGVQCKGESTGMLVVDCLLYTSPSPRD